MRCWMKSAAFSTAMGRRFRLWGLIILTPDSQLLAPDEVFMTPDAVVQLARETLFITLLLAAPILAVATVVSLLINIAQVMTSIQEHTVATVPRIAVVAVTTFVLLPWILRKLVSFTAQMFADFHRFLG